MARSSKDGAVALEPPVWMGSEPTVALGSDGRPEADLQTAGFMVETNGGSSLERVAGFNSYRARNAGLLLNTPLVPAAPKPDQFEAEHVFGPDDRVAIDDPTALPWRCIALLTITYESGATARGTGWFFGPRALGTAGHNVRDPVHGSATSILVSPGFDGQTAPFGTYAATESHCHPDWLAQGRPAELDYAVVILGADSPGRRLGWFGIAAYERDQLLPLIVNVSGYPADRWPQTQYYNGGRLTGLADKFLLYTFDTEAGMSGAPIFALFDRQRVVVGIHTAGSSSTNRARRIDPDVYRFMAPFVR